MMKSSETEAQPPVVAWQSRRLDQRIIDSLVADDTKLFDELAARGVSESLVREHARALGLALRVVHDPDLEFDVDEPDDLARLHLDEPVQYR